MNKSYRTRRQLLDELQELTSRMMESEETLRAIRNNEVDGLVVSTTQGDQIFTLSGADYPYRVMVETMNEGAVTLSSDGMILFCNKRFVDIVKGSLETVIGSSVYQFISHKDIQLFKTLVEHGLNENDKIELSLWTGGDHFAPVLLSVSPLQSSTDLSGDLCMIVTDLTEQKHTEEMLEEGKLTTQILQQAAEIFVLCDHQGRIIRTSQSIDTLFGINPILQKFDEVFHLFYTDGTPFVLLSAISDKPLHAVEVNYNPGLNKLFYFLLSANRVITDKGAIDIVVVMVDITERKKMEEELQQAYDGLEKRIEERTTQLLELNKSLKQEVSKRKVIGDKLKESRERLRNLTNHLQQIREKERSHLSRELHDELGQVLTGLKMDVRWIERRLPEDSVLIAERLNSIIILIDSAILSVQRLSMSLRPPALDDFGLNEAIELVLTDFEKRTNIACEFISTPHRTILDREVSTEVFRILQEALTNVARHAHAQRVTITLKHRANRFTMEVRDDGKGITEKEITDPLSIGLTGMRERVYALEGTIEINGVKGKGTTVSVIIPLHEDKGKNSTTVKRRLKKAAEEV